ncbi:3-hydroxybutyryl-CoA dehydrogenase [Stella humosa]|uniref:L-gulonate 3-dehydrogenase n=1 Tax=Stella humosa TaxID=94 RepID=A0A3N1LIS1_9PROT|nr:3-hydroxyacyl-CoA dehydrogenase family protein [Stella humosa]ROP90759.1 3-hydroxybutyryl-CoA dehydrogenase [Stella humosa]BBK34895.1 butyryl-CoA dehydrogenase [Stella humosa]
MTTAPMPVAVLGAGTMGHALALVHALGGHPVRLYDNSPAALARAPGLMHTALATIAEAGEAPPGWTAARLDAQVRIVPDLAEAVAGAGLVVEAVAEDAEVKRQVFAAIDALAPEDAILASNTSMLDIFPLVPARRAPRTLIAHWYTPPYLVDLVDVVAGPGTDPAVVEQVRALYAGFGKHPIVLRRFVPGFIANRLQGAIGLEIQALLDAGVATPADIDDSIRHGLALRMALMGQLMKTDFTGLELSRKILANRSYTPPEATGRSATLDRLVEAGRTGVHAGAGYYDYGGRSVAELFQERDRKLFQLKRAFRAIAPLPGRPVEGD